ncbi:GLY3 [Symbiodinium sp. KB8]|nr:GLY3 [Symbiodinium sp. KB8]
MEDLRTVAMEYQRSLTENLDQFYVVVSGQYLKKMNRTDDIASWDGWEFFVRSKEYAFACVLFRRQYIPPLFSTCQDRSACSTAQIR